MSNAPEVIAALKLVYDVVGVGFAAVCAMLFLILIAIIFRK